MTNQPAIQKPYPAHKLTAEQRAELVANLEQRYTAGASIRALAEESGYSYGAIHGWLTGAGVTLRPRGGANRPRPALRAKGSGSR
ncbi:hypothetical protein SAMN04488074_11928 [Lentzea albidocapillata subsp. violacea]|uniref:Helix-turn-helix domain-containing protein n=1 Tax=Lentzea albidocapillata subsp. violacea TaxID=128104 RepID=A0A1G9RV12_9PSEU|nr:helix-turn-helix domain-containing protein [Lentzea albidocapillata]SDM27071.1 hypothetical protein SAMN04488074_11928 [Lentzea albidocapillata subsp. violacea]